MAGDSAVTLEGISKVRVSAVWCICSSDQRTLLLRAIELKLLS